MIVDSVMSSPAVTIDPENTVQAAARLMRDRRVGSVVVSRDGTALGILTERDLTARVIAEAQDPATTTVEAVMSAPVITIKPSAQVDEALEVMEEHGVRRLVVQLEDEVRGVVTVTDVAHVQPELNRRLQRALSTRWEG